MNELSRLWPRPWPYPLGTIRCGDCDGTGSITVATSEEARTCATCEGTGEVEDFEEMREAVH